MIILVMLIIMSTQAVFAADSYLRWVYWENEKSHIATQTEMAAIIDMIATDNVKPNLVYTLATGVSFRIPKPDLYLEYLLLAIKKSDPRVVTIPDAVEAVLKGDIVEWGNDISYRVKNYYFSSLNNRIQYIDNYTGTESETRFLLINGYATIKLDCGNPLEVIGDVTFSEPEPVVVSNPVIQDETPVPTERHLTVQQALVLNVEIKTTSYREPIQPVVLNRRGWVIPVVVVGGITVTVGLGYLIYSLISNHHGGPGGAPVTIPTTPIVPVVPGGGPGGAPTTK